MANKSTNQHLAYKLKSAWSCYNNDKCHSRWTKVFLWMDSIVFALADWQQQHHVNLLGKIRSIKWISICTIRKSWMEIYFPFSCLQQTGWCFVILYPMQIDQQGKWKTPPSLLIWSQTKLHSHKLYACKICNPLTIKEDINPSTCY